MVLGILLVYIIRENNDPAPDPENSYVQQCIACAPLTGAKFAADAQTVHIIILSCVEGKLSAKWITKLKAEKNGQLDYKALFDHYEGTGKHTRRIAQAKKIRDSIYYKSEKSFPFSSFLNRLQTMFNVYEKEEEPWLESAKTRFLYSRIQHP
mmetsp:Transcript_37358/g.52736  ORF Transcript_37358/g.52736 Transcript_37358/m.52736 type:complete len:152 (-) Transcript_37358:151-606(-)